MNVKYKTVVYTDKRINLQKPPGSLFYLDVRYLEMDIQYIYLLNTPTVFSKINVTLINNKLVSA